MAINQVITIDENDTQYTDMIKEVKEGMNKDNLVIIARSEKNRKADDVRPLSIKKGIYFYVAYSLQDKLAFPCKYDPEDIEIAKRNTINKARIGNMFEVLLGGGKKLSNWTPSGETMNVTTLYGNANGAGLLLCEDFWKAIHEKFKGDFYILPSSIRELILVSKSSGKDKADLDAMVRDINMNLVNDDEFLADQVFEARDWMVDNR